MNDKIKINLQIADSYYPLTINRDEEETVRVAAKQVISGSMRIGSTTGTWLRRRL